MYLMNIICRLRQDIFGTNVGIFEVSKVMSAQKMLDSEVKKCNHKKWNKMKTEHIPQMSSLLEDEDGLRSMSRNKSRAILQRISEKSE